MKTTGYAAHSATTPLVPYSFERRALRADDVAIEILYCGVCHSDLHTAQNDWGGTQYPVVVGHEIIGRVIEIGEQVTQFKVGDHVAVGCLVDSCKQCDQCNVSHEQYCRNGAVTTYNSPDPSTGTLTQGGYSKHMIVRESFILSIPPKLDIAKAAPLLCAGITTYSPLRHWKVGMGTRVGIIGLGGLGHMAVKFAVAMGAQVTVISRSPDKEADARELGAHHFLISTDKSAMHQAANTFELIIDTVPIKHDINPYLPLLDVDGTIAVLGQVGLIDEVNTIPLLWGRRQVSSSLVGGIAETQEMLNFCAEKNILPDCEMIQIQGINEAFERMVRSDVHYRFVIDMSSLQETKNN